MAWRASLRRSEWCLGSGRIDHLRAIARPPPSSSSSFTFAASADACGYPAHMPDSAAIDRLARILSILGHPLLVLPMALALPVALQTGLNDSEWRTLQIMLVGFALFVALMLGWSWLQVRRKRWTHVDASQPSERRSLNRTLLIAITIGALLAWRGLPTPDLGLALALSAGIIIVAMLSARACKLSLHVAFSLYAAGLLWPLGSVAVGAGCAFAGAVAWSRLRLSRHERLDLFAGAAAGLSAAIIYWPALHTLRASP